MLPQRCPLAGAGCEPARQQARAAGHLPGHSQQVTLHNDGYHQGPHAVTSCSAVLCRTRCSPPPGTASTTPPRTGAPPRPSVCPVCSVAAGAGPRPGWSPPCPPRSSASTATTASRGSPGLRQGTRGTGRTSGGDCGDCYLLLSMLRLDSVLVYCPHRKRELWRFLSYCLVHSR